MDSKLCLTTPTILTALQDDRISERHLYLLRCGGIYTCNKLATQQIRDIQSILSCDAALANYIVAKAYSLVPTTWFQTSQELQNNGYKSHRISLGCFALDELVGGGVALGEKIEIFGESGTGKTQLCLTLCVTVQLTADRGGLQGKCLYVDTRRTLRPERISEILSKRIASTPPSQEHNSQCLLTPSLDNVIVVQPKTSDQLFDALISVKHYLSKEWFPLLILDGITTLVRSEYPCTADISTRNSILAKTLALVTEICEEFQVAVVVTNTSYASFSQPGVQIPYGGALMEAFAENRLHLTKPYEGTVSRKCKIYHSSHLAVNTCEFFIRSNGVTDK